MKSVLSRRLLQLFVSIMALLAIVAGGLYLAMGVRGIGLVGVKMSIDPTMPPWQSVDYLFRAISGVLFAQGLMFAYLIPRIEKHTIWFRFVCLSVFLMGIGRLLSVVSLGTGSNPLIGMVLELIFPPLMVMWQARLRVDG